MSVEQVGGTHYHNEDGEPHWHRVERLGLPYHLARATAHVERAVDKGEMREDLLKAISYLQDAIVCMDAGIIKPRNQEDPDAVVEVEVQAVTLKTRRGRKPRGG